MVGLQVLLHVLFEVVIKISVLNQIVPTHSVFWVVLQTAIQEIEAFQAELDVLWKHIITLFQISFKVFFVHACEGGKPSQHFKKDCAQAPHVDFVAVVFALQNFWCHVERRSALCFCQVVFIELFCEPEVSNYNIAIANE